MRTKWKKIAILAGLMLFILLMCSGCLPHSVPAQSPSGFFSGLIHGWLAPISLILGAITGNYRIYEVHNIGWWYDFGFYIAVISEFGTLHLTRKRWGH